MEFIPYEDIQVRASLGTVKDYTKTGTQIYQEPKVDYSILLDMMRSDPVIATAFDTTVDVVMRNGYTFISKNEVERKSVIEECQEYFDDILDFDRIIRNALYQYLIYGEVFLELRRLSGKIAEVWPLETSEMAVDYDEHGRITQFVQRSFGVAKESYPIWTPDEIVYIRAKWIGSQVYSYSPLEPIGSTFTSSVYAHNYLKQIFKNLPPKMLYSLMGANDKQRKIFIENLRQSKENPAIDIVAAGNENAKITAQPLLPQFDNGLFQVLEYLREQVLMITRVPPVWVGLVNTQGAERGNSEAQIFSFMTRVYGIQRNFESHINKELMPKLGYKTISFKFNNVTEKSEESIINTAVQLFNMGASGKDIVSFLRERGIDLPKEIELKGVIEQAEEKAKQMFQNNPQGFGKIGQDDTAPSRRRENKMSQNMKSNVNQEGVSKQGEMKTKEQNMGMRSSFSEYPYLIE